MTLIKRNIPAFLLAALIAFALTVAMGMTAQKAYAYEYEYEVKIAGVEDIVQGQVMYVSATVEKNGAEVDLPEGTHIEWYLGDWGMGNKQELIVPSGEGDTNYNKDKYVWVDERPGTSAMVITKEPGEDQESGELSVSAALMRGEEILGTSDDHGFLVATELIQTRYYDDEGESFEEDHYLLAGKTQDIHAKITKKKGELITPVPVYYRWSVDNDGVQVLDDKGTPVTGKEVEGTGNDTFTFKRTDANRDTEVALTITDREGTVIEENYCFQFYAAPTDLADYQIEFNGSTGIFFFIDQKDLPVNRDSKACKITLVAGNGDGHVVPEDEYDLKVQKVVGYDEVTWEDVLENSSFPLNVDPEGAMNINGNRTDGTAQYVLTAVAKSGSSYTGQTGTGTGRLWLVDRKTMVFPNVDAGFPEKNFNENQFRYEVKTGKKLTPYAKSNETGKALVLNQEYTVTYVNTKTSKVSTSFPKKAGTYNVVFSGIKPYYGQVDTMKLLVGKKNPIKAKGKTIVCKTKMKNKKTKKAKSFKASRAVRVKKAKGTVSYTKVSGSNMIEVADSGKVTVKKGTKKGTYKIKVKVTAQGTSKYISGSKTVKVKVRVK